MRSMASIEIFDMLSLSHTKDLVKSTIKKDSFDLMRGKFNI